MNILVDAYGGDNAPLAILEGVAMAVNEYNINITLCGKEKELTELAKEKNISLDNISFIEAETIMPVEVDPTQLTRKYKNSSLAVAMLALADGKGDAIVSAGSTGAVVVGATLWVKRIKGIKRPALGIVIPNTKGCHMLIDGGANSECRPEMLTQFGIMGSVYMKEIMKIDSPRVGMVNIGTEPNKGLPLQIQASEQLKTAPVNFIGNIEASQIPVGGCDVAVTDGFTGNIILKLTEGMAKMMGAEVKDVFMSGGISKIAGLIVKGNLDKMKKKLDASEYGGTPLLGVKKPVIKAHGSSNPLAIKNAIRQAKTIVEQNVIEKIESSLMELKDQEL